jgi:hypothetical protein
MNNYEVYLWNNERAIQLRNTVGLCRGCGKSICLYPAQDFLRHILTHLEGDERKEAQDLILWLDNPENRKLLAQRALQEFNDPKLVEAALKLGILVQVSGKG